MTITKSQQVDAKALLDQIKTSIYQIVKASGGDQELVVKILDGHLTSDRLEPAGSKLTVRLTLDVYPKTNSPE